MLIFQRGVFAIVIGKLFCQPLQVRALRRGGGARRPQRRELVHVAQQLFLFAVLVRQLLDEVRQIVGQQGKDRAFFVVDVAAAGTLQKRHHLLDHCRRRSEVALLGEGGGRCAQLGAAFAEADVTTLHHFEGGSFLVGHGAQPSRKQVPTARLVCTAAFF